jgi:hypothetical protein
MDCVGILDHSPCEPHFSTAMFFEQTARFVPHGLVYCGLVVFLLAFACWLFACAIIKILIS